MAYAELMLAVVAIAYVFYQTVLHPLAKYPGPFIAKLTNLYSVWHALVGSRHIDLYNLHKKHGKFVRWGPDSVSVLDPEALEQIYGQKANVQKSTWYGAYYSISIFNAVNKDVHARKKRVMSHGFSDQAVRETQPYILTVIREWCAALGDRLSDTKEVLPAKASWSTPKDMSDWAAYNIFDSLGEVLLGASFRTTTSNDNRYFLSLMPNVVWYNNIVGQMPILSKLRLDRIFLRKQKDRRANQIAFCIGALKKRLALGPDSNGRRDIIHYLQQARDPETGEGYSETELAGETVLLMAAGSDTANTALTSIWYFLAHHPDVLSRLTASIRTSFSTVEEIEAGPALAANAYLKACVDECMRLCPPIPMLLPREVCPGGATVLGETFPAGSVIGVPTYALHHSAEIFADPWRYDPSRWLPRGEGGAAKDEGSEPEQLSRMRAAFVPFSVGPRACIGRAVALLELHVTVARVLFEYDLRLAPGTEHLGVGLHGEYRVRDNFIVPKEGPILQFKAAAAEQKA